MFEVFVRGSERERWRAVETLQVAPQEFFTSAQALEVAAPRMRESHTLLNLLEQEAGDPRFSRDAIGAWDADDFHNFFPEGRPIQGAIQWVTEQAPDPRRPAITAWHERGGFFVALPPGTRQIQVRCDLPAQQDEFLYERQMRFPRADLHENILDWRTYAGNDCAVIDGWTRMRRHGEMLVASLRAQVPFLIGKLLRRRVEQKVERLTSDPSWRPRLAQQQHDYPNVAAQFPALNTDMIPPHGVPSAIIFVHGTVSCGIGCLEPIAAAGAWNGAPIFRFEHDTFEPIASNATCLVELIQAKLPDARLLLVAHSRGGLVSKMAIARLRQHAGWGDRVELITLGTPHQGTPLVKYGDWILNQLIRLGVANNLRSTLPSLSPHLQALVYLVQSSRLPYGLEEMMPSSPSLQMLDQFAQDIHPCTRSWGSAFRLDGPISGYGVMLDPLLDTVLGAAPHDLVVPTASAEGFGTAQPTLNCSHSGYLSDATVLAALAAF